MNLKSGTATAAAPQKVRMGGRKLTWEAAFAIDHQGKWIVVHLSRESFPEARAFLGIGAAANKRRSRLTGGAPSRHIAAS
ncbi:hypothetical protein MAE02_07480 [Microvirga aerophila]|uniref:Uncharacterized protein n=1 Tax=Microvirga aerophila TaxID=670291 RepID=A0A512BM63_9HYPH|nr:hypothetical protein MAE02_07480 [Microvirga aerophila]